MTHTIYIDGEAGTTGLEIRERLEARGDLELILLGERRRDVEARRMLVRRGKQAVEAFGQVFPKCQHFRTRDSERGPAPERHDAFEPCGNRRMIARRGGKAIAQFRFAGRRQRMEQRHVGRDLVALGRIVLPPQAVGPGPQVRRKLCGDDERRGFVHAAGVYISPRDRRMANHLATLALCSASVSAKTCPPVPSATI